MNILHSPKLRWFSRTLVLFLLVCLIFAPAYEVAQADPVTIVFGVLATVFVAVGVDLFSCGFNVFFYCARNSEGGGGGRGPDGPGGWRGPNTPGDTTGETGGTGGTGGTNTGTGGAACSSTLANACGMYGVGFVTNGVCSATTPPNSVCPTPTIGDEAFRADPALVRKGNATTLYWDVEDATICSLSGGLLSLTGLGILGDTDTGTINEKTVYTLTCTNGPGGPSASAQATVNLVPSFEEI